jgi:transforming growth factor-beta-induced protein
LCATLQETGLDSVLSSAGPFTVFAPTNEAFEALERSPMDARIHDVDTLTDILLYHVVADNSVLPSGDLACQGHVPMANGDVTKTVCHPSSGRVYQIGRGNVASHQRSSSYPEIVEADVEACNGIVHVVDNVILPKLVGTQPTRKRRPAYHHAVSKGDKKSKNADSKGTKSSKSSKRERL